MDSSGSSPRATAYVPPAYSHRPDTGVFAGGTVERIFSTTLPRSSAAAGRARMERATRTASTRVRMRRSLPLFDVLGEQRDLAGLAQLVRQPFDRGHDLRRLLAEEELAHGGAHVFVRLRARGLAVFHEDEVIAERRLHDAAHRAGVHVPGGLFELRVELALGVPAQVPSTRRRRILGVL